MLQGTVLTNEALGEKDIACVPRKDLFDGEYWTGVRVMDEEELFHLLTSHMVFHERNEELEHNESLKQIIPYFLVKKGDTYLTAVRKVTGGDSRLHHSRLIGFGGHLNAKDITGKMSEWLQREFDEEVHVEHVENIRFLGIVNEDSGAHNSIGLVHMGLIFEVLVSGEVSIAEQDKFEKEAFLSLEELKEKRSEMESWSGLVLDFIGS